jgi:methyl-accepting chemotaxis protein
VTRFRPDLSRSEYLVASIVGIAEQTTTLAVESALEAAHADVAGKPTVVVEQVCRLAVGAGVATGELAWLAHELDASPAGKEDITTAGAAITGLQSLLLTVAAAVHELADAGAPAEIYASAKALRTAALQLDDLLPAYQPAP